MKKASNLKNLEIRIEKLEQILQRESPQEFCEHEFIQETSTAVTCLRCIKCGLVKIQ